MIGKLIAINGTPGSFSYSLFIGCWVISPPLIKSKQTNNIHITKGRAHPVVLFKYECMFGRTRKAVQTNTNRRPLFLQLFQTVPNFHLIMQTRRNVILFFNTSNNFPCYQLQYRIHFKAEDSFKDGCEQLQLQPSNISKEKRNGASLNIGSLIYSWEIVPTFLDCGSFPYKSL